MAGHDPRGAEPISSAVPRTMPIGEDFYIDPRTGFTVFTKKFLLRRGFCCTNGCRNCPYKTKEKNMKVLITSGGTKVKIDRVRHIGNMSSGNFGSKIATEFLKLGHSVHFLRAKGSKSPMSTTIDLCDTYTVGDFEKWLKQTSELASLYSEHRYETFDDYRTSIRKIIETEQPDLILLAAAVSDYGVKNYVNGKIRSSNSLTIELDPYPKVIKEVRVLAPNAKLVGFKLLVDSTEDELHEAARASIRDNGCDMVVANDLRDIKRGQHQITLVFSTGISDTLTLVSQKDDDDPNMLARMVAAHAASI